MKRAPSFVRLGVVGIVGLATLVFWAAGCTNDCPQPAFASPVTAVGPTPTAAGQAIVVRWPASPKDRLPTEYYRQVSLGGNGSPTPVRRVALTAEREITLDVEGLDGFVRSSKTLEVVLGLPDTRGFVPCNHPGRGDEYWVTLKLSFDEAGRVGKAEFSPVHRYSGAL